MSALIPNITRTLADAYSRQTADVDESVRSAGAEELLKAAREATRDAADAAEVEAILWRATARRLRQGTVEEQLSLVRDVVEAAERGLEHLNAVRRLWAAVVHSGGPAEGTDQLAAAEQTLTKLRRDAEKAIDARVNPWRPKDPERFEREMLAYGRMKPEEIQAIIRGDGWGAR